MTPLEVRGDEIGARVSLDGDAVAPLDPAPVLPDVSRLPGAAVVGVASHEESGVRVVLGCVRAPSARWVPGLQSVVFERATPMILGAAAMRPALARGPSLTLTGASFAEQHRGTITAIDGDREVVVAHALAFFGRDADAIACSFACSAPRGAASCDAIAASFVVSGDLRPEPAPGLVARAILGTANHPVGAMAISGSVALAIVAILLATRPRMRPGARARRCRPVATS